MQPEDQQVPGAPQHPNPTPTPPVTPPQPAPVPQPQPQPPVGAPVPQPHVPGHDMGAAHPAAAPASPAFGQGGFGQPAKKKPPVAVLAAIVAVGVVILGVLGYFLYTYLTGIKLETYTGDKFSLLVPVDYTKDVSGDTVTFTEKGDESSASKVVAYYNKFPSAITEDQLKTIKDSFKTQLEGLAKGLGTTGDEVEQFDVKDIKFQGKDGFELTAKFKKDGKEEGNVRLIAVITTTEIYVVGVAAHSSDGSLDAKKNEIIDSFKVK